MGGWVVKVEGLHKVRVNPEVFVLIAFQKGNVVPTKWLVKKSAAICKTWRWALPRYFRKSVFHDLPTFYFQIVVFVCEGGGFSVLTPNYSDGLPYSAHHL